MARVVRASQERWDGRGYPDRLRGEEIDPSAVSAFLEELDHPHALMSSMSPDEQAVWHLADEVAERLAQMLETPV